MFNPGTVTVQLVVDAQGARQGVADFEASMAKAKAAAESTGQATATSFERAQQRWVNALAATDPVMKASLKMQQALATQQEIGNRAVELGIATQAQAAAQMEAVRVKQEALVASSGHAKEGFLSMIGAEELLERSFLRLTAIMAVFKTIEFAKEAFEEAAALKEQAAQAGVSVEAFQAYRSVLEQSGISAQDAATAIAHLTKNLGEALEKAGPARDALLQLGLSYADVAGGAEQAIPKIATALLQIPEATKRSREEVALFGKAGQELESALQDLIDPTASLIEKQKALGLVLGTDVVDGAEKARTHMTESIQRLKDDVAPPIAAIAAGLANVIELFTSWQKIKEAFAASDPTLGLDPQNSGGGAEKHLVQVPTVTTKYFPGGAAAPTGSTGFSTAESDKLVANAKLEADLAGLSAQRRAEEEATIGLANKKLQEGSVYAQTQEQALTKQVGSYKEARDLVGAVAAKQIEQYAATTATAKAADKLKETFAQYLTQLHDETRMAGQSAAQREQEMTIVKAAKVLQTENNVLAKDQVKDYAASLKYLTDHGEAQKVLNDLQDKRNAALKLQNVSSQDNLDLINLQIAGVGQSNLQLATSIALMKEQQALKLANGPGFDPAHPTDVQQKALDLAVAQAAATVTLTAANENYNQSLTGTRDLMAEMAANAHDAAQGMAEGFGKVGKAIGDAVSAYADYNARQAEFSAQQAQINRDKQNGIDITKRQTLLTREQSNAEDQYYADTIDGAKNMFGEKTAAYKVLSAIEGTYNALRLAGNIEAMISDAAGVAAKVATVPVHVAANTAIAASGVAAGAGQIFAELGPWGFPVVAAMLAVMLGLGFSGGAGSSSAPAVDIAKQRQAQQGAGTVLGDATTKSDSIAKSLDQLAKDSNTDLEYGNQMVSSLKAIENSIGSLTSLLARQLAVGGLFDTSGLNLGKSGGNSGILGTLLGGIFGNSKTTNTLLDQGINIAATTIGQAVAGGLQANAYQTVQSTKTNSYLFGLLSSSKTSTAVNATPLSSDFTGGIESIIGSLRSTVLDAATKLGVQGAQDVVDSFSLSLGSISFKDMTGSQIQDTLTQVFGALGDKIAAAAVPQIAKLQLVGEGSLETLARLVQEYTVVDDAAKTVGFSFTKVGVDSLAARDSLVQMSGGLDQFASQANFFSDNFLTKAQALAPVQQAVTDEMARLGQAGVATKDQFAAVVQGIDASTASGAQLYAALMNVAPAFAKVADAAAELDNQRMQLQMTLLTDTGDALGALNLKRQQELAALDASLVPLQQQIYAAEDAATAAAALKAANDNAAADAAKQLQADQAAAAKVASLASARANLEITLMQDTGDAAGALALKRQQELAALDASLVPLQQQIYAAEDLNAANLASAAAAKAAADALNQSLNSLGSSVSNLTGSANDAAKVAQAAADSWGSATNSLTQASTALLISSPGLSPADQYAASRSQFDQLRSQGLGGDASAASSAASFASQFLQSSFGFNGSTAAYGSDYSYVKATLDQLTQVSQGRQSAAQAQADAFTAFSAKLTDIAAAIRAGTVTSQTGFNGLAEQVQELADEIAQENLQARHG